jgi:hypothetical protein
MYFCKDGDLVTFIEFGNIAEFATDEISTRQMTQEISDSAIAKYILKNFCSAVPDDSTKFGVE